MTKKNRRHILAEAKAKITSVIEQFEGSWPLNEEATDNNRTLKAKAMSAVFHLKMALEEIEELERKAGLA